MNYYPYDITRGLKKEWIVRDRNTGTIRLFITQKQAFKYIVRLHKERNGNNIT